MYVTYMGVYLECYLGIYSIAYVIGRGSVATLVMS